MQPTVAFRTLGCKLNQCETAQMEHALDQRGYRVVEWDSPATVRVLNTCTVTAKADAECRREIRRMKRADPSCRVAVTGCYAQVSPDKLAALDEVDLVLGNLDKSSLPRHLDDLLRRSTAGPVGDPARARAEALQETPGGTQPDDFEGDFITHFSGYSRAFLKVQNGCDAGCSYCIIPTARGRSRSMRLNDVLTQVRLLGRAGYREVALTGIHLGMWGRDTGEGDLADLLAALAGVDEVARFRLSSTEPMEVDDRVLAVMAAAEQRFAEHFHLPLQSGSDTVLRRMNRPYRTADYADRLHAIRERFPDAAIGADVIVGFPGETDDEFAQTVVFVAGLPLTYLHVFAYSDRPGTRASAMRSKVIPETISARSADLRALGARKNDEFQAGFAGRVLRALVLHQRADDGRLVSLTGNYMEVLVDESGGQGPENRGGNSRHASAPPPLANRFVDLRLTERRPDGRWEGVVTCIVPWDGPDPADTTSADLAPSADLAR